MVEQATPDPKLEGLNPGPGKIVKRHIARSISDLSYIHSAFHEIILTTLSITIQECWTPAQMLSVAMLNVLMLGAICSECHILRCYAECHYVEYRGCHEINISFSQSI